MKAKIVITGGIGGNSLILRKLKNYTDYKNGRFGSFIVQYDSVTQAKQDLKDARNLIIEDYYPADAPVHLSKTKRTLYYDASSADLQY